MKFSPENYKIKDERMKPFIDIEEIENFLEETRNPSAEEVKKVIAKSLDKNRLTLRETAILINANTPELIQQIKDGARELKEKVYGNRIVLFAPLYIGNKCKNNCLYCGFRASNKDA
ncbi:MAG: [FeFe] hydrogenase H-cluster radical SAM maturase HydG, partial [Bacteroidales bacterium]|nr:[FeFe] hydrogenase H-cluster radical SAM maturase HydG [Bacteroidales bacterium]